MIAAFLIQSDRECDRKRACFELKTTAKPALTKDHPSGSVLIRTVAASICGSDFSGQGPSSGGCSCWRRPTNQLKLLKDTNICGASGHELLGEVVNVVEPCSLRIGQRVLAFSPSYMKWVIKDELQQRSGITDLSVFETQGGFAQYFISHDAVCLPVPAQFDKFDPRLFVMAQPLGTILHACRHLDNVMGKTIAVVGQGQNGLMMTQILSGYKPRRLIVLDLLEERLEAAKKFQVTHIVKVQSNEDKDSMLSETKAKISKITNGEFCDLVVDMVGHQNQTIDLCAQLAKPYGTVLLFGLPPAEDEPQFSIRPMDFSRNIRYVTTHTPRMESFELAVELLQQTRFDPTGLITHTFPFERFPEAYEMAQNYEDGVIKVLLTFENTPVET